MDCNVPRGCEMAVLGAVDERGGKGGGIRGKREREESGAGGGVERRVWDRVLRAGCVAGINDKNGQEERPVRG